MLTPVALPQLAFALLASANGKASDEGTTRWPSGLCGSFDERFASHCGIRVCGLTEREVVVSVLNRLL